MNTSKPNFIIAGVMKGSTSAAAVNLNKHEDIYCVTGYWKSKVNTYYSIDPSTMSGGLSETVSKELDFFNIEANYNLGIDFYKQYFPRSNKIQGEASPNYFAANETSNEVVTRMHTHLPDAKIIIILRDPITRAYSHFNMIQSKNPSWGSRFYGISFNSATEQKPLNNNILQRSTYLSNLNLYRNTFGSSNVYVTLQELISADPVGEYNKIYQFLGAETLDSNPGYKDSHITQYSGSIDSQSETWLRNYFSSDVTAVKALYPDLDYSHWNTY